MLNISKYEDQNKGLPTNFRLDSTGKFLLVGGKEKVDDNMTMFLAFFGLFRLHTSDYVIHVSRFVNKTTSYLFRFKNILRLKMLLAGKNYIPFAKIHAIDIPLNYQDRKKSTLYVQFRYNLKNEEGLQTIKKVIV